MPPSDLKAVRNAAGLKQSDLADLMGIGLTTYQDLEGGTASWKPRHQQSLERVSLKLAVERRDLNIALPSVRRDALDYAKLFGGS